MSSSLVERKRALRGELTARRECLSREARRLAGECVARAVISCKEFLSAERVALYAALPVELPTRPLFEASVREGKCCLFPRCTDQGDLAFAQIAVWEELMPGRYGVREPAVERRSLKLGPGDLALVPGIAFDRMGRRLGRGGGYYDRTFAEGSGDLPTLFGCGFAVQLVEQVPADTHDRRMDAIVTESGVQPVLSAGSGK